MGRRIFLTDKEVASVLEVSEKTLYRMLRGFYLKGKVCGERRLDIKSAAPTIINGTRRWNVVKLASVLGVTPEEIERRIL